MDKLVYLVNPSERAILSNAGDRMPLGILYIAKQLLLAGDKVKVFDLNHTSENDMIGQIRKEHPDMVGVSCYTSPMVKESQRLLRRINAATEGRVIVGGYHATYVPEDFAGLADNVVVEEGEYITQMLAMEDRLPATTLVTRGSKADLGFLGKPARHLLDHTKYNMQMDGMRTATMITSRGCPNECSFCGNYDCKVRTGNLSDVVQELREIKDSGYQAVYFLDDVFTLNGPRARDIGEVCKHLNLPFRATTRANYLNEDKVIDLAINRCDRVSLGIESGNDEVLARVGKHQTTKQIREAVSLLHKYKIPSKGFFIIGLPGETEETAIQTIEFARELKKIGMTQQDFYPLMPFPGTAIFHDPKSFGLTITEKDYTNYLVASKKDPKVVCETEKLKSKQILELLLEARGMKYEAGETDG